MKAHVNIAAELLPFVTSTPLAASEAMSFPFATGGHGGAMAK